MIDDNIINKVWEKGLIDRKFNPDFVRKDACGAWIIRDKYNDRDNPYGWEIDHIYPKSKLVKIGVPEELIDNVINLRPLHWKNNVSKGSDYPHYQSKQKAGVIKDDEGNDIDVNISCEDEKEINEKTKRKIEELFKNFRL